MFLNNRTFKINSKHNKDHSSLQSHLAHLYLYISNDLCNVMTSSRNSNSKVLTVFEALLANIKKCFWRLLSIAKYFTENNNCFSSKEQKSRLKNMCQYARDIFVCRKCISVWLFTVKALLFPENYTVEFILCGGKPTMNWFFPSFPLIDVIDLWLKDWFQVRTSIAR